MVSANFKVLFLSLAMTGMTTDKSASGVSEVKFGKVKWQFRAGATIAGSPVNADGVIFAGDGNGVLYAIDNTNGKELWQFETGGALDGTPTVSDGVIYFVSRDGHFYAVNCAGGTLVWKFATRGEAKTDAWDYYLSTPAVDSKRVYFGSGDQHVYALDRKTGQKLWAYKTGGIVHGSPAQDEERIYVGGFDGVMTALNKTDGSPAWTFKTVGNSWFKRGAIQGSPLLHEGVLYFGSRDYNIYAVSARHGHGMWNERVPSWVIARPTVVADTLYFGNSEQPGIFAMNVDNGKQLWHQPVGLNIFGSAVAHDGQLYFPSFNGILYTVSQDGKGLATAFQTHAGKKNYNLFFDEKGDLRKEILASARTLDDVVAVYNRYLTELGAILSTPVIVGNTMYVTTPEGLLYALQ